MEVNSTGNKLSVAFGFLIFLLFSVGWLGLTRMGQINSDVDSLFSRHWDKMMVLRDATFYTNSTYRLALSVPFVPANDPAAWDSLLSQIEDQNHKGIAAWAKVSMQLDSEKERDLFAKMEDARLVADKSLAKLVAMRSSQSNMAELGDLMVNETIPALNEHHKTWLTLFQFEQNQMNAFRGQTRATFATAQRLSSLLILLAICIAIGMAVYATRKLVTEMKGRESAQMAVLQLNEGLERKVSERTEELAQAVEILEKQMVERSAREEELRKLASIVECSDDAIIAIGMDKTVTDWNAGAERILGFSRDEMVGKPISAIIPQGLSHELNYIETSLKRGDAVVRLESKRIRKDGKIFPIALTVSPIRESDGRITRSSGILRDITEIKSIEDALRRSEASYRSLVDNAPFGILRGTPDGKIRQVNPALVAMLGYVSEEEVLKLSMARDVFCDPADRENIFELCRNADSVHGVEVEWKRKNGKRFTVRCDAHVVRNRDGNVEFMEAFIEDISERRVMEMELRQGQKMEAIGRLAGGVAHDFNNLLGVIMGYSDVILDKIPADSPLLAPVKQIKKAGDRASALTRQLLAFSRRQALETKVLNVNAIVADMAKMLPRLLGEDIELRTSLASNLGPVKADQGQLEQVIMNLAVNARDAMPAGGRLSIETRNSRLDEEFTTWHQPMLPGDYVILAVSDTGTGMDAQTQARIFEPFFTTKEPGRGTGLGLARVYGFVKQSGGYVWVQSELGVGSVFEIYLPLTHEVVPQAQPDDVATDPVRETRTVLLVEDEESLRTLTRAQLEESGYTVLEADCGNEAIRIALDHRGPIDLLLTDVVMPGMNGRTVAEKLAASRPETKVVFMSGYTGFNDRGIPDSKTTIIPKPFTRDVLLHKLGEALHFERKAART